ncbi:hypothetical protein, partial [Gluconobacter sphaericus]
MLPAALSREGLNSKIKTIFSKLEIQLEIVMPSKSKQTKDKQILKEDNRCYICNNLATTIDHLP